MSASEKDILELKLLPEFQLIEQQFPHIALLIELNWGHKDKFLVLISNVGIDYRGGRQGFPREIFSALMRLSIIHDKNFIPNTDFHISGTIIASLNKNENNI